MAMTERTAEEIRSAVSAAYGARARDVAGRGVAEAAHERQEGEATSAGCCDDGCCADARGAGARERFYADMGAGDVPETAVSYGCGNPVAIAGLRAGETVLDLGSGAGLDCFLAARQVGPAGRVIGLDMTDDMLALAEQNKAKLGAANVAFKKGVIEALPLPDASVDVIISNCVINLSPDKDAVFREAFRVLRPGGRLHVSDVVLLRPLAAAEQDDLNLWAGCVSGALAMDDYARRLAAAGFADVSVEPAAGAEDAPWRSALIQARRPGGAESGRPWPKPEDRIELIAPAGLATAACCAIDGDGKACC